MDKNELHIKALKVLGYRDPTLMTDTTIMAQSSDDLGDEGYYYYVIPFDANLLAQLQEKLTKEELVRYKMSLMITQDEEASYWNTLLDLSPEAIAVKIEALMKAKGLL